MSRSPGFTILELLLTLVVLSVVAAVAIPAFFAKPEVTLENASVLLAHDLRAAQNRAAYLAEPSFFWFTPDGDGYRVLDREDELVENPATGLDFVRRYSEDAVFAGVVVATVDCGGDRVLEFDDQGRAAEDARITLAYNGGERVVLVESGSGKVTIQGTTSGWRDSGY